MKLRDLLNLIHNVAETNDISNVNIVGGIPRDKLLKLIKPNELNDLDITTGNNKVHNLAREIELELKKHYTIKVSKGDDAHTSIIFPRNKFKLDFSSNFISQHIDKQLEHNGIKNPTDMQKEMFSRDFTANSLLLTLDLKTIKDPTHLGLKDIEKRVLTTCLDPSITFHDSPNRIIRAVYLSAKLDFDIDPKIIVWISQHKDLIRLSSDHYIITNINKAMSKNPERAVYAINKMDLWNAIPITDSLKPYYAKKTVSKAGQLKRNFDLGEGLYSQLDRYKSVSDFRKKRRKKRMKILKKIRDMKLK